jgi:hypothetical protein
MNSRDKERLRALRVADLALYKLGKQCYFDQPMRAAVDDLQYKFIHPEIKKLKGLSSKARR